MDVCVCLCTFCITFILLYKQWKNHSRLHCVILQLNKSRKRKQPTFAAIFFFIMYNIQHSIQHHTKFTFTNRPRDNSTLLHQKFPSYSQNSIHLLTYSAHISLANLVTVLVVTRISSFSKYFLDCSIQKSLVLSKYSSIVSSSFLFGTSQPSRMSSISSSSSSDDSRKKIDTI